MRTLAELLDEVQALSAMSPEHRSTIAGCARNRIFTAGELLLREGEPADEFFVLRAGSVAIETDVPGRGAVPLDRLRPGELLGWSWLLPPYRAAFDARATVTTRVLAIDGACLRGKCERDPALGYDLLKVLAAMFAERLQDTRKRLLDVYAEQDGVR